MVKDFFNEDMKMQTGSLLLLATLCDKLDKEDIQPLLLEFIPTVFTQFDQIMSAMRDV